MWHICTVHWRNERWIRPQRRHLERHLAEPFTIWAALDETCRHRRGDFDHAVISERADHGAKLDDLADKVTANADPEDFLLFLDGDAFPIAPIRLPLDGFPKRTKLVAIQRPENGGELFPHPSFCLTTVEFWNHIGGTWRSREPWRRQGPGPVSRQAPGSELHQILAAHQLPWCSLNRTNRVDLHPVFFGIYGDLVYHHGAGFRGAVSYADIESRTGWRYRLGRRFEKSKVRSILGVVGSLIHPWRRARLDIATANQALADRVAHAVIEESSLVDYLRRELDADHWQRRLTSALE